MEYLFTHFTHLNVERKDRACEQGYRQQTPRGRQTARRAAQLLHQPPSRLTSGRVSLVQMIPPPPKCSDTSATRVARSHTHLASFTGGETGKLGGQAFKLPVLIHTNSHGSTHRGTYTFHGDSFHGFFMETAQISPCLKHFLPSSVHEDSSSQ